MYKLLIADDEGFVRRGIKASICWEELGIGEILEAEDGQEAYEIAIRHKPDIILSDIRMPKLSGVDLAASLRERLDCQIIFISAYSDKEYYRSAIKFQVLDYVEKPINLDELIDALKRAVSACWARETTISFKPVIAETLPAETALCEKILNVIRENYCDPDLSISSICKKVYSSRSNVCAVFKQVTGKTLNEAIMECRMAKARGLLRNTDLSFTDIARCTGFRDPNYFTKFFKKRTNQTPSEYRKESSND